MCFFRFFFFPDYTRGCLKEVLPFPLAFQLFSHGIIDLILMIRLRVVVLCHVFIFNIIIHVVFINEQNGFLFLLLVKMQTYHGGLKIT